MIPKIIHYCWFGNSEMPDIVKKYISSWKEKCPDYQIMRWSEENFDINVSTFTKQAYENKKYAFVSDYVRFYALDKYGGIYLDVDMELLKSFDDLLYNDFFIGYEGVQQDSLVASCVLASVAGHSFNKHVIDMYNNMEFVTENGDFNMTPNTVYITKLLKNLYTLNDAKEFECEGMHIYEWDYFHPLSLVTGKLSVTDNTYAIHHHTLLWVPLKTRLIKFLRLKIVVPLLGEERYCNMVKKVRKKQGSVGE